MVEVQARAANNPQPPVDAPGVGAVIRWVESTSTMVVTNLRVV